MKFKNALKDKISMYLSDEEFVFKVLMGFKFLLVSTFCTISVLLFTYLMVRIDLIFFISHGFPGAIEFENAFVDFVYSSFFDEMIWVFIAALFIFFLGYFVSGIMIRPFKIIAQYCEDKMNGKVNSYTPDFFSSLKLLTSFSVFFFSKIDEAKIKGQLKGVEIPSHFMGIHKPNFEKNFFFNYLFIIVIFGLLSSLGIVVLNIDFREQIYSLSKKFLAGNDQVTYFLNEQFNIANIAVYFFVGLHLFLYLLLGIHLYSKVATPAFAVFATMRSFIKGNHHNRVHLIGHYYLRNDCRQD